MCQIQYSFVSFDQVDDRYFYQRGMWTLVE